MSDDPSDEADFLDPSQLLAGRTRRRAPHLLFLLESWSDRPGDDVFELLESIEAFAGLTRDELGGLLALLEPRHLPAGEVVVTEGESAAGIYLVAYGRLRVYRQRDGGEEFITELSPGDTVGEGEVLTGAAATASVRAVRDSFVLLLSPDGLQRVTEWHPDVPLRMAKRLLRRSVVAGHVLSDRSVASVKTIALVPAGPEPVPVGFVEALVEALESFGSVHRVSSRSIDEELGEGTAEIPLQDARNGRVVEWLQRIERAHRVVLYEADPTTSAWTTRCLRQADRVVRVARAHAPADLNRIEQELLAPGGDSTTVRQELVLLHPGPARPRGTQRWMAGRVVDAHHHVRLGETSHYQRLARLVTGQAVGVVFGGGGARGASHLGVVRALEEAGVPIDVVGGTSIGCIAAFMCAMGWDHEQRMEKLPLFFSRRLIIQPTLPFVSLSSGRRLLRLIDHETEQLSVEDLWVRFFSVSTNLSQAVQVVHQRGDLATALRASVSLPGILPPVRQGQDLLVDGGLLNNLPIDVMQSVLGGGRIIAVDLRRRVELTMRAAISPALSGWQVLGRRIRRGPEPFDPPSIG
ncbi:MAG TPA: patatin-like phospholipase family protein, partial [Acidimicrobiales bacterium]|nr:patatin-like phospholipase family protein [Acidimicrobiales bacterium]